MRERHIGFAREVLDLLLLAVFENGEVALLQIPHQAVVLVANRAQNVDQIDVDLDGRPCRGLLCRSMRAGRSGNQQEETASSETQILRILILYDAGGVTMRLRQKHR